MKICLGFYGFIRTHITRENVILFLNTLPSNRVIDIYISTPNRFNEFDSETITENIIIEYTNVFKNIPQIKNIFIKVYEYDPRIFILKSQEYNLPFKNVYNNIYPFRILSCHYSMSMLCSFIKDNGILYDTNIITRFDIFSSIKSFGNCVHVMTENIGYIWRTIPYESKDDAEDRIIIGSHSIINAISHLYNNNIYNIYHTEDPYNFTIERILGSYLKLFKDIVLLDQSKIDMGVSPTIYDKYTHEFDNKCNNLLAMYNIKYRG